jgi:hypothetical protein
MHMFMLIWDFGVVNGVGPMYTVPHHDLGLVHIIEP